MSDHTAEPEHRDDGTARRSELVLAGQKQALELALHGAPLAAVLEALVRTVETQSSSDVMGSILLVDDDGAHLRHGAAPNLPAPYTAAIDGIAIGPGVGSCGSAAHSGETIVVADVQTDPRWAPFRDLAAAHGLRACWSTPIRSSSGQVLATFALYHRVVAVPSSWDQEIVRVLGSTAAVIIERDQHARRRADAERALRSDAEQQLARLASLFDHAPAAIAVVRGPAHVFEISNPAHRALSGGRDLLGKAARAAFPELEGQGLFELLDEVRRSGTPYEGRSQRAVLPRTPGGEPEERFFDFVYQPVPNATGAADAIMIVAFEVSDAVIGRQEAEAARRRAESSERELRTFIDDLPELAWTARPDGYIDFYNRRWYEYTGTTFEEMQGWGWEKVHDRGIL